MESENRDGMLDNRVRRFLLPTQICFPFVVPQGAKDAWLQNNNADITLFPGCDYLLDFGSEVHGGIRLDIPSTENGKAVLVRVTFGESISEAMGTPNNDHTIHQANVWCAWMGFTEFGSTGFRFVRIQSLQENTTFTLRQIHAVTLMRDLPQLGSFSCSDTRLNSIWDVGARTVHLCLQDHVWDGIKRDRLVWIGDLHPEAMVTATVFGRLDVVEKSLDLLRDRTGLPGWMNGISSYSLWWVLIHKDWYMLYGDRHYLSAQLAYLAPLLGQILACMDEEGHENLSGYRFLEWPTSGDPDAISAGLQALVLLTLEAGAFLCRVLEADMVAIECEAAAARMRACGPRETTSKQAVALQVLAGLRDPHQANLTVLSQDPYRGISTFYGYYVLEARTIARDITGCLDLIRTYWGGMIDMGATSFWEGFEIDWMDNATPIDAFPVDGRPDIHADFGDWCYKGLRHSLCHGWAAGPTAWLQQTVLGIRPSTNPEFDYVVHPQLGDLDWAKGSFPTQEGLITVEIANIAGVLSVQLQHPAGLRIDKTQ